LTAYKLLASDLDDSLLDDRWRIGEADREAIARAVKAGVKVVLATGRMFRSALPYALELGLETPLVTYQGALVKFPGGRELLHRPVPWELALELLERLRPTGFHVNIYIDDQLLVDKVTEAGRLYWVISKVAPVEVGDLADYLRRERRDPTKLLLVAGEEKLDPLMAELNREFAGRLHMTKSKPFFLEFMYPGVTKAGALQALADHYGIGRESIIAVGDSYNDLEMIAYAGLGAVVANARDEIKGRADFVTLDNNHGGVARVIKKFIFHEED